jgi:transcriptional regulator with XRE-family HTH domain
MPHRLPNRLRAARLAAGFSDPTVFAAFVRIKPKRYKSIEEGKVAPTLDELSFIARITNKTLDFIVRGMSGPVVETITPILVGAIPVLMFAALSADAANLA